MWPVSKNVANFFNLRDKVYVQSVFERHADTASGKVSAANFAVALQDISQEYKGGDISKLFEEADIDLDGSVDLEEFSRIIVKPTELEKWSKNLPLAKLLAYCLESVDATHPSMDPLRIVSSIGPEALETIANGFSDGLKKLLSEEIKQLKDCFVALERKAVEDSDGSSEKFVTFSMSAGKVEDFHKGLTNRVGEREFLHALPNCTDMLFECRRSTPEP